MGNVASPMTLGGLMSTELILTVQLAVGLVFLQSSAQKLAHPLEFFRGLMAYRLFPRAVAYVGGVMIILGEIVAAFSYLTGWMLESVLPVAMFLLCLLTAVIVMTLVRGLTVPCLCFGARSGDTVSVLTVVRLGMLILASGLVFVAGLWGVFTPNIGELTGHEFLVGILTAANGVLGALWLMRLPTLLRVVRPAKAGQSFLHPL